MGQALYRQYRPKSLGDVVGQEHITSSLLNALKSGKLAHAYLFTGPRGVGKTSIARILAHEINSLPYEDDAMHLDIIEIDAASNRRIDEIRELRDKVHIAPTSATYKVYIIDEVHMLTREAFNALLKTLEEPPAHVVFILATTEVHKLPETIISRTQRFMFKPVPQEQVVAHLRAIATKEKLEISDEALALIAAYGEGSFRDSISLLDQTRGQSGAVDADAVRSLTGIPTDEAIADICQALDAADAAAVTRSLSALHTQGFGAAQVAKRLGQQLRQQILDGHAKSYSFDLLEKLLEVPVAHDPESYLELVILAQALAGTIPTAPVAPTPQPSVTVAAAVAPAASRPVLKMKASPPAAPKAAPAPRPTPVADVEEDDTPSIHGEPLAEVDAAIWPAVLGSLKKTHNTLYGIVRMATPIFYDDAVELHFTFAFHKRRLAEAKNQQVVIEVFKAVTGRDLALRCVLDDKNAPKPTQAASVQARPPEASASAASESPQAPPADTGSVSAISNIFGGAEVL